MSQELLVQNETIMDIWFLRPGSISKDNGILMASVIGNTKVLKQNMRFQVMIGNE
jgi:hypothetical protein